MRTLVLSLAFVFIQGCMAIPLPIQLAAMTLSVGNDLRSDSSLLKAGVCKVYDFEKLCCKDKESDNPCGGGR